MIAISHDCSCETNPLIPQVCKVIAVTQETSDVKSFRVQTLDGRIPFSFVPGQLGMFGVVNHGECMFCVSMGGEDWIEFTVKKVGTVTERIHQLHPGAQVTVRGPYGNFWPADACKGRNMIFIAGGIGLPPVRTFLLHTLANRSDYGRIDLVYSASTKKDLVFKEQLFDLWPNEPNMHVHVSVYRASDDWDGPVEFTAPYLESLGLDITNTTAVLCGGPSLYRTCSKALANMGVSDNDILTTLEMRMKCGIGKCGRCNVGSKYICLDGPVFTQAEVNAMLKD
ncbi:MAG: FAD/NAD(P)-binding protein [Coriobacteriales bacterium]|jgi:NAD(P)H-flavin reductase|nr:FAD/NAD(P)-binding protein [Coriobacteriales bacterium]